MDSQCKLHAVSCRLSRRNLRRPSGDRTGPAPSTASPSTVVKLPLNTARPTWQERCRCDHTTPTFKSGDTRKGAVVITIPTFKSGDTRSKDRHEAVVITIPTFKSGDTRTTDTRLSALADARAPRSPSFGRCPWACHSSGTPAVHTAHSQY